MFVWKKTKFFAIKLSLREISFRCVRARAHMRANGAKIVRSRDAQCNTEELP